MPWSFPMSSDSNDSKAPRLERTAGDPVAASGSIRRPDEGLGSRDGARRPVPGPRLRAAKDRAALAMSSGRLSQAFAELVALAADDPGDGQWPLKAGDALRKLGNLPEAIRFYHRATLVYREQGHIDRAMAVARMIGHLSGDFSLLLLLDPARARQKGTSGEAATRAERATQATAPPTTRTR